MASLQEPRGIMRMALSAQYALLCALVRITPWPWLLESHGWRRAWAVWVFALRWRVGERIDGRI